MIVLLLLYPVVFLFGLWVQTPLLIGRAGLPFWLALFIGNVVSVLLLNWLVPWTSTRLRLVAAAGGPAPGGGLELAGVGAAGRALRRRWCSCSGGYCRSGPINKNLRPAPQFDPIGMAHWICPQKEGVNFPRNHYAKISGCTVSSA